MNLSTKSSGKNMNNTIKNKTINNIFKSKDKLSLLEKNKNKEDNIVATKAPLGPVKSIASNILKGINKKNILRYVLFLFSCTGGHGMKFTGCIARCFLKHCRKI